jgi:hypothetical protein
MSQHRSLEERTADVREALSRNPEVFVATASPSGQPHVIAASSWWDRQRIVVATTDQSRTARNLDASGLARLVLGTPDDMIVIDVRVTDAVGVNEADPLLRDGFAAAAGWNPADEGPGWRFFQLSPLRIQAYRGYGELPGREVMRGGTWLADR